MIRAGGIVLCGGQSKRMGKPKAWLPFGDELMLQRVVRILGTVVHPVVVVAARDQEVPPLPANVMVARDQERDRGPLQGLAAGFAELGDRCDAAYLSSCDAPFLQPAFVQRMIDLLGEYAICVPKVDDSLHPLAALYRVDVANIVRQLLAHGRKGPVFLCEQVPTRIVLAHELADIDPSFQSLRNLNSAEDYAMALREIVPPEGFRTAITATLSVRSWAKAIDFYKAAFGATELYRVEGGGVAQLSVAGAEFWVAEESPEHLNFSPESLSGCSVRMLLNVENPAAVCKQAVAAGATQVYPVADAHGWRIGRIVDPFGHHWEIARQLHE